MIPSVRKCGQPLKAVKIQEPDRDVNGCGTRLLGRLGAFLFPSGTSPHLIQGDLANPNSRSLG